MKSLHPNGMPLSLSFIQQSLVVMPSGVSFISWYRLSIFSGRVGCLKRWRHTSIQSWSIPSARKHQSASIDSPQVHTHRALSFSGTLEKCLAKHSNRSTDNFSRGASAEIIFALDEEVGSARRRWRVAVSSESLPHETRAPNAAYMPLSYFWHPPRALWLSRSLGRISPATNLHELAWPGFFLSRAEGPIMLFDWGEARNLIQFGQAAGDVLEFFWGLFLFDERTTWSFMSHPRRAWLFSPTIGHTQRLNEIFSKTLETTFFLIIINRK